MTEAPLALSVVDEEQGSTRRQRRRDALRSCRFKLIDAWIRCQQELMHDFTALDDNINKNNSGGDNDDDSIDNEQQRQLLLQGIRDAAEAAHGVLEQVAPFLGQRSHLRSLQVTELPHGRTSSNSNSAATVDRASSATVAVEDIVLEDIDIDSYASSNNLAGQHRSPTVSSFDAALSQRCDAVLAAWATVIRTAAATKVPPRWTRGIPQRAQFLLEQMDRCSSAKSHNTVVAFGNGVDDPTTMMANDLVLVRPSVESYNSVLEAWAYSSEHLRGAMSERIFQKLVQAHDNAPASGATTLALRPNGESYRLVVRAWALSRDRRAAFTATGHLMKMLRKLGKGDEDMEPTLDDYTAVLQAWTRAE